MLRIPRHTNLIAATAPPRGLSTALRARPAFQKALADQMKPFRENEPAAADFCAQGAVADGAR